MSMMLKVRLETSSGHFVTDVDMPYFLPPPPAVLIWGSRVFLIPEKQMDMTKLVYTEVIAYVVPPVLSPA